MALFSNKTTFFDAAMTGDTAELAYCIDQKKFSVNSKDIKGNTILHVAIHHGQLEAVRLILSRSPDLEQEDKEGLTPLMRAMEKDKIPIILAIIRAGANPNTHDRDYIYPLHKAAMAGEADVVKALVEAGADVNVRTREFEDTPLHFAITSGRRGVAEYLVANKARIDIAGKDGKTQQQLAKDIGPKMLDVVDPGHAAREYKPPPPPSETWDIVNPVSISKISTIPALHRKITEIFNFETQERVTISQNTKTNAETITPAEPFAELSEGVLEQAAEKLQLLGGRIPGAKRPKIDDSPIGRMKF